uniref:Zinc knuckle CX2CX4HX4C n=1 Tax=Tanacetum cinerariifolium TaxID=118510 RepID=A0A6L2N8G8_TANCI|nr:hypothetical protein [Tanacetum cinerariifolium]
MAIPLENGTGYTREVIKVEYEWKSPHCIDCKIFGHTNDKCPKRVILDTPSDLCTQTVRELVIASTASTNSDGFTEVKRKKNKSKKADLQTSSRHIDAKGPSTSNSFDALNNVEVGAESGESSSRGIQEVKPKAGPKTFSGIKISSQMMKWMDLFFLKVTNLGINLISG